MTATSTPNGVRTVKSASRTIALLEYLASRQANPPHLAEVCAALGAPRSSVYALLRTLVQQGWVQSDGTDGYSLGIRVLIAGTSYIDSDPYVRIVRPILVDLSTTFGETFHMGRIDGDKVVYLFTQESHRELRAYSRVGRRMPATATALGKVILAHRPELIPETFERLTEFSITNRVDFDADVATTLERGYSTEDQENTLGVRCIAFPLPYSQPVTDAISCSIPKVRWTEANVERITEGMRAAAIRIVESAPVSV